MTVDMEKRGPSMSNKRMVVLFVAPTVVGLGLFLGARYIARGRISTTDWVAVAGGLAIAGVAFWASARRAAKRQSPETAPPLSMRTKVLLGVVMLISLSSFHDLFKDAAVGHRRRQRREQMRKKARIIRTGAGRRDATGWVPARSTDGRFSVQMPNLFNEMVTEMPRQGRTEPLTALSALFKDAKFMVVTLPCDDPEKTPAMRLQMVIARMKQIRGGQMKVLEQGLYADRYPRLIIECHVDATGADGLTQAIILDGQHYMLTVECPELTEELRTMAQRFFQSFEVLTLDPNTASDPNAPSTI